MFGYANPKGLGDTIGGDIVMGGPDSAGGEHIIVATTQLIHCRYNIVHHISDNTGFHHADAKVGQFGRDVIQIHIPGSARTEFHCR